MDVLLVLFLAFLAVSARFEKTPADALDKGRTLPLRGAFALGILLHHTVQFTSGGRGLFQSLELYGGLFVSVFFALSGYALSAQYAKRGEPYLRDFLKKRLGTLLIPYGLLTVFFLGLYALFAVADGKPVGKHLLDRVYMRVVQGEPLVPFSWYVEAIAYLYLLFYGLNRVFHGRRMANYLGTAGGLLAYIWITKTLGYGEWWYNSCFAFLAGMFYFDLAKDGRLRRVPSWLLALGASGLFLAAWSVLLRAGRWNHLWLHQTACFLFPLALFLLSRNLRLQSPWLDHMGRCSYEIYLAQSVPSALLGRLPPETLGGVLRPLFFLTASLLLGQGLHWLSQKLRDRFIKTGTPI